MSNLIFTLDRAPIEQTTTDMEEVGYDHQDLVQMSNGIEQALESLHTLKKLQQVFAKQKNKPVSKSAIKLGKITLEHIKNDTGIFKDNLIVSQECFTQDSVSLEGIADVAKSIWEAIVRTFKALWEKIAEFFRKNKADTLNQKVKNDLKTVKESDSKKSKDQAIDSTDVVRKADLGIMSNFAYIGRDVGLSDLINEISDLQKTTDITDGAIMNLEIANMNMAEAIRNIKQQGITDSSVDSIYLASGFFTSYVKDEFERNRDLDLDLFKLIEEHDPTEAKKVDKSTIRTLHGITRGDHIVAYMRHMTKDETMVYIEKLHQEAKKQIELKEHTQVQAVAYLESLVKLTEDWRGMCSNYNTKSKKINNHQHKLLSEIEEILYHSEEEHLDTQEIDLARSVTSSMMKFSMDMVIIVRAIEISIIDHQKVSGYLAASYRK